MKAFYHLLANNILATVTNFTVWFALTFFTFLQTNSVFATSIISGLFLVLSASSSVWFGNLVDNHKKKQVILWSSVFSLIIYIFGFLLYITAAPDEFKSVSSIRLWVFIPLLLIGVIAGNVRNIALPAIITFLVKEDRRDKANGLAGTAGGIGFMITSVFSGILVGHSGMFLVLLLAVLITLLTIIDLLFINLPENKIIHDDEHSKKLDIKGTIAIISKVDGLFALIFFTTFNNFLGGVFMSLMDAYGLSLVKVEVWGLLWGFLSTAFIIGGGLIAKFGLGKNPLRAMFIANVLIWSICSVFTVYPSIVLLVAGMFIYLCVVPYIQASEMTIIQKVVPLQKQGKVFGFAQSVEQAASPLTAFAIGPITQFIFIPFMTTGAGVDTIGQWFGTGPDRGIALVFTTAGIIGLTVTLLAWHSKYYRLLSERVSR